MLEAQAQPTDLLVRAQGGGQRDESAALHHEARNGAVLDLDRVDPRRRLREHRCDWTQQIDQQIVGMDRVGQQDAAELGFQPPSPWGLVILRRATPSRLDRRQIRPPGDAGINDALGLLHSVAEALLKDWHDATRRPGFGRNYAIDFGDGSGERFLADDLFARRQRREDLREMERRRRADVDDLDIIHPQYFVKRVGDPSNGEFIGELCQPPLVNIA